MCGVPFHSAHTYVERLIEKGYKVAICEQVENPAEAKGVVRREVVRVITPGTVMEENMLVDQENNFLVVLSGNGQDMALAAADLSTGECHVTQWSGSFDRWLDEVSSYQPREVVLDETLASQSALRQAITLRLKAVITPFTPDPAEESGILEALPRQFERFDEICDTPLLRRVATVLLGYLTATQKRSLGHLTRLRRYDARQYMVLDESARRNLELTVTLGEGKRKGSLLWLLDKTATAMGSRLIKKWLDKPLLELGEIQARQDVVQAFLDDWILFDEVTDLLKQVYDLERLAARISFGSANARDLVSLKRSLSVIPDLRRLLIEAGCPRLRKSGESLDECADIRELVERAIVDDPPVSVKEGGMIREGYSDRLDELRNIQKDGKSWITSLEKKEREETGIKSLKIGYNRVFGYYIEVTKSNLHLVPEGRYIRKQTLANAERYVTPELKEREERILHAAEKSVEMEYELFTNVRAKVAKEVLRLQELAGKVAELDVLRAFAQVARHYGYVRPVVTRGDRLYIKDGRHPVVEAVSPDGHFVANDVELDANSRRILLVTGPNMAGKSTFMRQVALIAVMAQIGSYVPAAEAEVGIIDRIFTRIGAADDLIGGRSTFMVEMTETCRALKEATPRSLILLDEVGRGTSTYDGMALAQAIVEHIHDRVGAKTLFSTHYHELTRLEGQLKDLVNVHARCVERDGKVVFLYRIVPGGADRSYGIHVAELAGLPQEVIDRARNLLADLEGADRESREDGPRTTPENGQLSLFDDFVSETAATVQPASAVPVLSQEEREALRALRDFDLMNKTPMDCMLLIHELKKKLN